MEQQQKYFDGGYFSYATEPANEIALVFNDFEGYFILEGSDELWNEVKAEIEKGATQKELAAFWLKNLKKLKYQQAVMAFFI